MQQPGGMPRLLRGGRPRDIGHPPLVGGFLLCDVPVDLDVVGVQTDNIGVLKVAIDVGF